MQQAVGKPQGMSLISYRSAETSVCGTLSRRKEDDHGLSRSSVNVNQEFSLDDRSSAAAKAWTGFGPGLVRYRIAITMEQLDSPQERPCYCPLR